VLMNAAAVETEALNMGLIEQGEELSEGQKILARHSLIMQQLGEQGATGDFKRTSEGLANTQRILHARLKDLGITLGQVLLPIAEKMADVTGRLITKFEGWSPKIQDVFNKVKELLIPVKDLAVEFLPKIASTIKEIVGETVIPALVAGFNKIKDVINDDVIPAMQNLFDMAQTEIPKAFDTVVQHIKDNKFEYTALAGAIGGATTAYALFKAAMIATAWYTTVQVALGSLQASLMLAVVPMAAIAGAVGAIVGAIALLVATSPEAREKLGQIFDFLVEDTKEFIKTVEKAINFIKRLIELSKQVVGPVLTGGGEIGETARKSFAETPVGKVLAPFIPNLASGGIVTRPTLAMIGEGGEPEAVIPLSKMGGMGTMNITVNMPAGADGNDVVQALEDYVRRNGSIPLAVNNLVRK